MSEPVVYHVTLAHLVGGKIDEDPDPFYMDFCPRTGDFINVDSGIHEVVAVTYRSNQSVWPTVYVNSIGDIDDLEKGLIKSGALKDVSPKRTNLEDIL
ncbi:hypothetical protein BZJ19_09955 [Salinivibrio proteolyticus]|uniref:hypothetical protein n=1 Tax=Salinivibrio proteolyticus TaxID=334715 RepID=UPI0009899471|nr:hypothetical protein [Salinivibrio proteolyticus]OOF25036.1 hypothetical protein BZJ19_09955 [Salinivibrio proteolyticus]